MGKNNYDTGNDVQCGKEPFNGRTLPDLPSGRISGGDLLSPRIWRFNSYITSEGLEMGRLR